MAFEHVYLLGKVELDVSATALGAFVIQSDIPGGLLADRGSVSIASTERRVVASRLPYNFEGRLFKFSYVLSGGTARLYGIRIWARELPNGQWQWYPLPVVDTPNSWSTIKLQIPPTAEDWSSIKLQVPQTAEDWSAIKLQIPPTVEDWRDFKLPIKPTAPVPEWVSLEVDA